MPDDRIEVKVPNMLAPESASGIEVEPTKEQEAADVGLQSPEEIKRPEPESSVVELPKREAASAPKVERNPAVAAIDEILEADLGGLVDALSPSDRTKFIAAGEALTAELVKETHLKKPHFGRTLDRITSWLNGLPMLDKNYLRQEAKRKNDQIIMFVESQKNNTLAA